MATRLLLAEDTQDLNKALVAVLEHEGYEVAAVFNGEEALERIDQENFDAIILDIMMPKKNGLEVLTELRHEGIHTPVLLLTAKAEVDDRVTGLDAGADDYLTKPFAMKELLARVRSMTRRRDEYESEQLSFRDITLNARTFELTASNTVRLSVKEYELLRALVTNADHGLAGNYLLGRVWRGETDVDEDTIRLYVSYLRGKLKWVGSCVTIEDKSGEYRLSIGEAMT